MHDHLLLMADCPDSNHADGVIFDPIAELDEIAKCPLLSARALRRERKILAARREYAYDVDDEDIVVYFTIASKHACFECEHDFRAGRIPALPKDATARGEYLLFEARRQVAMGLQGFDAGKDIS